MKVAGRSSVAALLSWATVLASGVTACLLLRPADAQELGRNPEMLAAGAEHYQRFCAACHGTDGQGMPGTGRDAGPSLLGVEVAEVDLLLRTGRMPLLSESAGVVEEEVTDEQRVEIVAWMTDAFDLPGQVPDVALGDPGRGQELYVISCAACHGSGGGGGIVGDGTLVPPVLGVGATAIAEAARVGPFEMPRFEDSVLTDEDLADIAAFVEVLDRRPVTPLGLSEVDQVQAAGGSVLVGLLVLGATFLVTRRRRDDEDPATGGEVEA